MQFVIVTRPFFLTSSSLIVTVEFETIIVGQTFDNSVFSIELLRQLTAGTSQIVEGNHFVMLKAYDDRNASGNLAE
jgi:hypothetical protein